MEYCKPKKTGAKHRLNIAVADDTWKRFTPVLEERWGRSFTSWVEFAMECYSRDACSGCPYDSGDQPKSKGIGKRRLKKT